MSSYLLSLQHTRSPLPLRSLTYSLSLIDQLSNTSLPSKCNSRLSSSPLWHLLLLLRRSPALLLHLHTPQHALLKSRSSCSFVLSTIILTQFLVASLTLARAPSKAKSMPAQPPTTLASARSTSTCSHATTIAPTILPLVPSSNNESCTATMLASMAPLPPSELLQLPQLRPQPLPPTRLLSLVSHQAHVLLAPPHPAPPAPPTVPTSRALVVSWPWPPLVSLLCCRGRLQMRRKHIHSQLGMSLISEELVEHFGYYLLLSSPR